LTNRDIAGASSTAASGATLTTLRQGDKQIPVVARLRSDQFTELRDVEACMRTRTADGRRCRCNQVAKSGLQLQRAK
jgi:multidrug efflux pump subunit AcrB